MAGSGRTRTECIRERGQVGYNNDEKNSTFDQNTRDTS